MLSSRPPLPSTGVALGAGVRVSVAAIGLAMMAETRTGPSLAGTLPSGAHQSYQTRRRADLPRRRPRRPDLRRELRRPRGGARVGGLRGRRADRRPLRDRRAPDLRLRHPDALAGAAGADGGRAPALRHAGDPHRTRRLALPAAVDL